MRKTVGKLLGLVMLYSVAGINVAVAEQVVPDAQAFQERLLKEIATNDPYIIIPYLGSAELKRKFARSLLDGLWSSKSYRDHLAKWIAKRPAGADDALVNDWYVHYHNAFGQSFDLMSDDIVKKLWRLIDRNAVYSLDRESCTRNTPVELGDMLKASHDKFLAAHSDEIAAALATAITREFARQDNPTPGDRPVAAVMGPLAMRTMKAVAATLPAKDGHQLLEAYSYRPNAAPLAVSEMCLRGWIVAHAVEDSALGDRGGESSLMRNTVTATAYDSAFRRLYKNQK